LRQNWWRGARSRGAPRRVESLAGVRVLQRRDPVADVCVALVLKQRGKGVREMCVIKAEVKVQKRRIRCAVTH
jgi:hypothetical protein